MNCSILITIVDPDLDYLGLEIRAGNGQFAGSTRVYAGLEELSDFADEISRFPRDCRDQRKHEFGSRDLSMAGGYCRVSFRCLDQAAHVGVDVMIDDKSPDAPASVTLSFKTEAAAIDEFVARLRSVEQERSGSALLPECAG